jgi:hypothetical protein
MKRISCFAAALLALVSVASLCAQQNAAEKPPQYTYVSEWGVPRNMWADYQKSSGPDIDMLTKGVADGTIVSWGMYSVLNHQEGQATHGTWFTAMSMANLMKMLETLRSAPGNTDPVLAGSKHWDYILSSRDYNFHSGTFKDGYLRVANWKYGNNTADPDNKIRRATMVAMLDKLMADGALHGYQIDEETIHSSDPDQFYVAIIAAGAQGLDKFDAAVEDWQKNNPTALAAFRGLINPQGHRDTLAHVDTMTHK